MLRTPVFELIQYKPQTRKVREQPLLVVPPMINKYYITDLAPDRSMIEHLVKRGQQVFAISWRNPDERHADWALETYVEAVARGARRRSRRSPAASARTLLGLCAGGITLSAVAAHLAASGEGDRIAGLTLGVCALDNDARRHGRRDHRPAASPRWRSPTRRGAGYLTGARSRACSPGCGPTT